MFGTLSGAVQLTFSPSEFGMLAGVLQLTSSCSECGPRAGVLQLTSIPSVCSGGTFGAQTLTFYQQSYPGFISWDGKSMEAILHSVGGWMRSLPQFILHIFKHEVQHLVIVTHILWASNSKNFIFPVRELHLWSGTYKQDILQQSIDSNHVRE